MHTWPAAEVGLDSSKAAALETSRPWEQAGSCTQTANTSAEPSTGHTSGSPARRAFPPGARFLAGEADINNNYEAPTRTHSRMLTGVVCAVLWLPDSPRKHSLPQLRGVLAARGSQLSPLSSRAARRDDSCPTQSTPAPGGSPHPLSGP